MIKNILQSILKKKNPQFQFDTSISDRLLIHLGWIKLWAWVRSFRLLLHGKIPKMIFLGRGVRFFNAQNMDLGKWIQLEDQVYLSALGKRKLSIGNNVRIGAFSRVIISTSFNNIGSCIKIGNNVGMGEYCYLGGAGGLEIGDDCIIGQYLSCHPENHNFDGEGLIRHQGISRKGIKIGKNCWIGAKVTILDGVQIGNNCVIAAGAVVNKSMPSNTVIGGVPARVIRYISAEELVVS